MTTDFDNVPIHVQEKIDEAIALVDIDKDGRVTYLEFLYILTELKSIVNFTENDIQQTKESKYTDIENMSMSTNCAKNWAARLYIKNSCQGTTNVLQKRDSNLTDTDWDVESIVNAWDLEKIVDEVFGNGPTVDNDATWTENDEMTEEIFEEFKKQRRRKRDIVLGILRSIIKQDTTKRSPTNTSMAVPSSSNNNNGSRPSTPTSVPTTIFESSDFTIALDQPVETSSQSTKQTRRRSVLGMFSLKKEEPIMLQLPPSSNTAVPNITKSSTITKTPTPTTTPTTPTTIPTTTTTNMTTGNNSPTTPTLVVTPTERSFRDRVIKVLKEGPYNPKH